MGIIAGLLFSAGVIGNKFNVPTWVVFACYGAISLGTLFGGWCIVKTMGQKITKLRPVDGFCAEFGAAITLFLSTFLGIPVSTTHTITGSIMGVGSLKRMSAVRWGGRRPDYLGLDIYHPLYRRNCSLILSPNQLKE
jgi:PiT family inorganic phosphate transporter